MGYDADMAEAYEIVMGVIAILELMEEERHDARLFVLIEALKSVADRL